MLHQFNFDSNKQTDDLVQTDPCLTAIVPPVLNVVTTLKLCLIQTQFVCL